VEQQQLSVEINKAYIDIANAVNSRTISLFPTARPALNGESWFVTSNQKQQGFRQVYTFTSTGNIPHGLTNFIPNQITDAYGSYTDGTNAYGVIFGTNVAIAGQLSVYVTSTNIVVLLGAGAPAISSGKVVLNWISRP
jgi:hypothetical protein